MARVERRQHIGDMVGADGADPQMAGPETTRFVEIVRRFLLVGEQAPHDVEQAAAGLGQLDAPAAAEEQLDPELALQRLHLGRDGGLADSQFARRGGETQPLSHRVEGSELGMPHIDFLNATSRMFELDKCETRPEDCQKTNKAKGESADVALP